MAVKKLSSLLKFNFNGNFLVFSNSKEMMCLSAKYLKHTENKIFCNDNMLELYKKIVSFFLTQTFYSYFTKVNLVGLGYKNFVFKKRLYILIGDCNYLIFEIPAEIKVICKKNQIYGLSEVKSSLFYFFSSLKKLKKINFYKGKGILEFNNFKFMKLKVGKKQKT